LQYQTGPLEQKPDAEGLWAWVDNYCGTHPLNSIGQAADALLGELSTVSEESAHDIVDYVDERAQLLRS